MDPLFIPRLDRRIFTPGEKNQRKTMKLLIVEDNTLMRRLMASLLRDLATIIHECADGAEALAAYREHRPDWVLMDIQMEQVDGLKATREIKAAFPEARIL